jgi:hypothetical protein
VRLQHDFGCADMINRNAGQYVSTIIPMFEHHRSPLLPRRKFLRRVGKYAAAALSLVAISWLIGAIGYHFLERMSWIDSLLNAAMILGGMGPVNPLTTDAGKLFASVYALFSGIVFLVSVGLLLAPILHRMLHQFHLDAEDSDSNTDDDRRTS